MTPQERRGKWLFLILASLISLDALAQVGLALSGEDENFSWYKSVVRPLGLPVAAASLWSGSVWLRWLVGLGCSISGVLITIPSIKLLITFAQETPPEDAGFFMRVIGLPVGLFAFYGLLYLITGGFILVAPSLQAFFRYQREGPAVPANLARF